MFLRDYIKYSLNDDLGKEFFNKSISFIFQHEFSIAFELIKFGLDIVTCDCKSDWLYGGVDDLVKLINQSPKNDHLSLEYLFVKAFIFSYSEDPNDLNEALNVINIYINETRDDYGFYIQGKIFIALDMPHEAILAFDEASKAVHSSTNQRILFWKGLANLQNSNKNGLENLYESFTVCQSSICCLEKLKKDMKQQGKSLNLAETESNLLLIEFNSEREETYFSQLYLEILNGESKEFNAYLFGKGECYWYEDSVKEIINDFNKHLRDSAILFYRYKEDSLDEIDQEYRFRDDVDWSNYNDNLDMDQQDIDFWNQF